MPRMNRLTVSSIDEVSSVDVDANGHAQILISKRDDGQGETMPRYFDPETKEEIFQEDLKWGMEMLGEDGEIYTLMTPEDAEAAAEEAQRIADAEAAAEQTRVDAGDGGELVEVGKRLGLQGLIAKRGAAPAKSLGATVLEQLSKSLNDADRDAIVSKALDVMGTQLAAAQRETREAVAIAKRLSNDRELESYAAISDELGVPVAAGEMAGILQAVSKVLTADQLDTFERVLTVAGNVSKYEELGVAGGGRQSGVMDQLEASAQTVISKANITKEQAMTALLEENPDTYDAYMDEQS